MSAGHFKTRIACLAVRIEVRLQRIADGEPWDGDAEMVQRYAQSAFAIATERAAGRVDNYCRPVRAGGVQ